MRITLIAFCFGVGLLQQQATLPPARWWWTLPLLVAVLWVPRCSSPVPETLRRLAVLLLGVALGFAWAAWRADLRLADRLPDHWQGVDLAVVGVVSDLPQADARGERFVLDVSVRSRPMALSCIASSLRVTGLVKARAIRSCRRVSAGSSRYG